MKLLCFLPNYHKDTACLGLTRYGLTGLCGLARVHIRYCQLHTVVFVAHTCVTVRQRPVVKHMSFCQRKAHFFLLRPGCTAFVPC